VIGELFSRFDKRHIMSSEGTDEHVPITKDEFIFEDELGHGAYSRVVLTTFKQTGKKYATKIIQKEHIIKEKKIKTVQTEKTVLNMMDHDNIIKLFCTYQDKENLCTYFSKINVE
jgi:3-phosphoinositide dependent protein kinase-1